MYNLLYLDSGAFSVSTGTSTITLDEYLRYLKLYGKMFDETFNLDDKFDDPDHNWQNQVHLEQHLPPKLKKPIPVVHNSTDPFGEFETYYRDYDYIAVGSDRMPKDDFFKKIKDKYPTLKIHMFGNLNHKMLMKHKPYSADAATFAYEAKHGGLLYWRSKENKLYSLDVGAREKKDMSKIHINKFKYRKEVFSFLDSTFRYKYQDVLTSPVARMMVNFYSLNQFEAYINSLKT
jgi:hypothetical protein